MLVNSGLNLIPFYHCNYLGQSEKPSFSQSLVFSCGDFLTTAFKPWLSKALIEGALARKLFKTVFLYELIIFLLPCFGFVVMFLIHNILPNAWKM